MTTNPWEQIVGYACVEKIENPLSYHIVESFSTEEDAKKFLISLPPEGNFTIMPIRTLTLPDPDPVKEEQIKQLNQLMKLYQLQSKK